MVAKSFQAMKQIGEPYSLNGKMYVKVQNPKTGTERQVRWYSDFEYAKLYPGEPLVVKMSTQKHALGFDDGYITICVNNSGEDLISWFHSVGARYNKFWGWYFGKGFEMPEEMRDDVATYRLEWEQVGTEFGSLKPENDVKAAVESICYPPTDSEYVGEVGEKLDLYLIVRKAIPLEGYFGSSTLHEMSDDMGNTFVWITSAKKWDVDTEHHLIGTVKEHKVYRNDKQTVLTRCREV